MLHFTGVIVRSRCVIQSADRLSVLATKEFGEPLHLLVIPGEVHHIEADALVSLADAPRSLVE